MGNSSGKNKRGTPGDPDENAEADIREGAEVTVYISPIMFIMAVYFVAFGMAYEFMCSLTAVVLHECAHARVAKKLGYALNRIKLMPYGAALCGNTELRPRHEAAIAAAGPIFNLVLGLIFAAMWWLIPASYMFTSTFCVCNIYVAVFNLLPVYPLDGGRLLFAALCSKLNRRRAYMTMRIVSLVFGAIFLVLFVLSAVYALNLCFLGVGLFMLVSAFVPDERARYYALFSEAGRSKRLMHPVEARAYAVDCRAPLAELCKMLNPDIYTEFLLCVDREATFTVSDAELIEAVKKYGYSARACDAFCMSKFDENT